MKNKTITTEIENQITEAYLTLKFNYGDLSKQFNYSKKIIKRILKNRGYPKPLFKHRQPFTYTINENYFEKIDSEDKAYFLGLMYADGCNDEKRGDIKIWLQERDMDILEKFNNAIDSNRPIKFKSAEQIQKNQSTSLIGGRIVKTTQNQRGLNIKNRKISQDLAKLGCVQKKSLIIKFPTENQVPPQLLKHFIRGLFDGDGSLCVAKPEAKRDTSSFQINGSEFLITGLKNQIQKILDIYVCIPKRKIRISPRMTISGTNQVWKILKWIYDDAKVYLNRKYNKYQEFLARAVSKGLIQGIPRRRGIKKENGSI